MFKYQPNDRDISVFIGFLVIVLCYIIFSMIYSFNQIPESGVQENTDRKAELKDSVSSVKQDRDSFTRKLIIKRSQGEKLKKQRHDLNTEKEQVHNRIDSLSIDSLYRKLTDRYGDSGISLRREVVANNEGSRFFRSVPRGNHAYR